MTIKIAACQFAPASEIEARKAQMKNILTRAEAAHVDFLCLPEGFLTGYYAQEDLARQNSLEVGGGAFEEWLGLLGNFSSTIIVGFNERDGNRIFDSAAVIENGQLLGVQRKHYLYHDYFTSGTSFSPFRSKGIAFGVVICLDTNYFEPARILALQGATILFSPMCNRVALDHSYASRPPYYSHFVARSHENRCWLIAADWVWANDGESVCPGHSCIYDPNGREIARSHEGDEDLLIADISKERLFQEKGRRVHGSPALAQELYNGRFNKSEIGSPWAGPSETLEAVPMPTGPYRIGTVKYDLEDVHRKSIEFPNGRLIPIQIYFPIEKGTHALYPKIFEERALSLGEPLNVKVHSQKADLSLLIGDGRPVILLNHASSVAMTDYAFLAEDLSSHGYVVVSIQHDLQSDQEIPPFWEGSSCSRNAKVIDNILYVFEWLKTTQATLFAGKIDPKRVGLIGHSLGGNSLLLWANRTLDSFYKDTRPALLPRIDQKNVKECLILMETTKFSFALNNRYPLFFLLSEERERHQKETECYHEMIRSGHKVRYYKGSTHISFMDHGYISPPLPANLNEPYFKGTLEERSSFFHEIRKDILEFLKNHLN